MDHNSIINELVGELPRSEPRIVDVVSKWMTDGQLQPAHDLLKHALERQQTPSLQVAYARFLLATGKPKAAMSDMVLILKHDPNHIDALVVLTRSLIECGEFERAQRMIDRTRSVGGPPNVVDNLQQKLDVLVGATGKLDAGVVDANFEERRATLVGGPNVSPFDVADPHGGGRAAVEDVTVENATVESSTFADLDSYMIMPDDDDTMTELSFDDIQADLQFDHVLQGMGVAPTAPPLPYREPAQHTPTHVDPEPAGVQFEDPVVERDPMQPTSSGIITSAPKIEPEASQPGVATPHEPTAAISVIDGPDGPIVAVAQSSGELASFDPAPYEPELPDLIDERQFHEMPSVEYDPGYLNEASNDEMHAPPDDLDQLPNFDATLAGARLPKNDPMQYPPLASAPPPRQAPAPDAPTKAVPARSRPAPVPQAPAQIASLSKDRLKPEPTMASGSFPTKKGRSKLPIIAGIVVVVLVLGAAGLAALSASQQTSRLATALSNADSATVQDTYEGYLAGLNEINDALSTQSFMGAGFDRTIHPMLPFESMRSDLRKRDLVARRALLAATIEARFEETGTRAAAAHVTEATQDASGRPEVSAAAALTDLAAGRPQTALATLSAAQAHPLLDEVRVLVLGALNQPRDVQAAAQSLAELANPTVRQQYLMAYADRLNRNRDGLTKFSDILAEAPDHVDSIIERSYLLREGASEVSRAEEELNALPRSASQFQQARAAVALGDLLLANKKSADAEEKFRDAIRKMPSRTELYEPLLNFYFDNGRYDDAKTFIEKAETDGRQSSLLTIRHGELLVLTSEPLKALDVLNGTDFSDPRKDWFRGLAYLFLNKYPEAAAAFAEGEKTAGLDFPGPAAFSLLSNALVDETKIEDALHQLNGLAEKHPEDENVQWALARTLVRDAERTSSKTKRGTRLTKAQQALEQAIKVRPKFPVFHYDLCEVHLLQLDEKRAEEACTAGRQMTKDFVPGAVILAKLRLSQGSFKQAYDDLKPIADRRPQDSEIGLLLARSAIEQRRVGEARKLLDKWVGKDVDEFTMQLLEGRTQFSQEAYTRAVGYLERAHTLRPEDAEAAALYAHALTRLGKHRTARKVVKAATRDPIWGGYAQLVTGEISRRRNKIADAGKAYAKAERWFKNKPVPTYQLAVLYTEMALAASARLGWTAPEVKELFTEARAKGDVSDPYLNFNLAIFYLNQKKPDTTAAIEAFEQVVEVIPNNCPATDALIKLYDQKKIKKKKKAARERFKEHCK